MRKFRDNGAIGALLDEYEKAIQELQDLINTILQDELITVVDRTTTDEDCKSIQTILAHVIKAGYSYVIEVRKSLGETIEFPKPMLLQTTEAYITSLNNMFAYNEKLFNDYPNIKIEENNPDKKISVNWGPVYNLEQLYEHAIVHILRHRRQIEKFRFQLRKK